MQTTAQERISEVVWSAEPSGQSTVPVVVHADAALPSIVRASFVMPDGLGHYYHRNSVLDGGFESLEVGSEVRFAEEQGAEGAQASTVTPVRRRRGGAACRPSSS